MNYDLVISSRTNKSLLLTWYRRKQSVQDWPDSVTWCIRSRHWQGRSSTPWFSVQHIQKTYFNEAIIHLIFFCGLTCRQYAYMAANLFKKFSKQTLKLKCKHTTLNLPQRLSFRWLKYIFETKCKVVIHKEQFAWWSFYRVIICRVA